MHLRLPSYQLLQGFTSDKDVVQYRIDQIVELDETRRGAFEHCCKNQSRVKRNFDKSSRNRMFSNNDMVLLWDRRNEKPGNHGKFDSLWKRPYKIEAFGGKNAFFLKDLTKEALPGGPVNGKILKHYSLQS